MRTHKIGKTILEKAALILIEKMRIKTVDEYEKCFGKVQKKSIIENEQPREEALSPMQLDEFHNILKNGWRYELDEPIAESPNPRRRTSMLADFIPMSPIASEGSFASPQKKTFHAPIPKDLNVRKGLFTSTPKQKTMYRTNSMPGSTPALQMVGMVTPKRSTSASRLDRMSPAPQQGETPLENRASRLRRLKLEEKMRAQGGKNARECLNFSF